MIYRNLVIFLLSMLPFYNLNFNTIFSQVALKWKFIHPLTSESIDFGTHGSVQQTLFEKGILPDPFYGENEEKYQWVENHDWTFETSFFLSEEQYNARYLELELPGVDTYGKIYLNDQFILKTENAFKPYRIQIRDKVKLGYNTLKVVFTSPINYHKETIQMRTSKLPAPNDVASIQAAPFSRKPQYQFGWDWALRMNTIGFLKPVVLHAYNSNRVLSTKVETVLIKEDVAELDLSIGLVNSVSTIKVKSKLFGELTFEKDQNNVLKAVQKMKNPRLWWPRGHGESALYEDEWEIYTSVGELLEKRKIKFGIRTTELIQELDQWGTAFYLKINEKPIFCKGANYIPQDVFPTRISDESIREMVLQMHISNFNMVRVWGGGYYQEEAFYEACDSLGIMVWQDFMFACAMYPGDEAFLKNVEEELVFQVNRLTAHPSLVMFNGNNEVDVAWKNWGFQLKYLIGPAMQRQIEADYVALFQTLAPKIVNQESKVPYVHTSPLSNWGKDEYFNHGTMHYWGVWHGKDPIEDFGRKSGRFNAEYGFQSFPEYATLSAFSEKKDWDLHSKVMKHHQKSYVGNGMIKKHADILFGSTKSFEEFVYLSQLTQAKAVGIAVAGHRTDAPRCMGTLYWQLNDCWQAPTWSSIDYYGNWKALQYQMKADYEDVAVLAKTDELGKERFFFVSDKSEHLDCQLNYTVKSLKGDILLQRNLQIQTTGNWLQEVCQECQEPEYINSNYVLEVTWNNVNGKILSRVFYHKGKKRSKASDKDVKLSLRSINLENKTAILEIENSVFLQDFWIYSMKLGVRFNQNFVHLLPGKHVFLISFKEVPELIDFGMKWL